MPWGVAAAGIGLAGTAMAGKDAKEAAGIQAQGTLSGQLAAAGAAGLANKAVQPYRQSGKQALNQLDYLMGLGDPTEYAQTENYFVGDDFKQYALSEAEKRIREQRAKKTTAKGIAKTDRMVAKKLDKLSGMIDKEGAWNIYQKRIQAGGNTGDYNAFFKRREGETGQGGGENGYGALMRDFTNADFIKDPGYQFRMDEGNREVQTGAAARGGLLSGAAMKAMQRYSQGFASNEFANAYNRDTTNKNNKYQRLSGMTDTGMRAAGATGANQMQYGQQAMQSQNDLASARASGVAGAANARSSGYQQAGNTLMDTWARNKMQNNYSNTPQSEYANRNYYDSSAPWTTDSNGLVN
jgi:hypothetical protein